MHDAHDPSRLAAAVWEQAAAKVRTLRHDGADVSWNDAIDRAVELLAREAENVREMGRMAHMLIAGNTERQD